MARMDQIEASIREGHGLALVPPILDAAQGRVQGGDFHIRAGQCRQDFAGVGRCRAHLADHHPRRRIGQLCCVHKIGTDCQGRGQSSGNRIPSP